MEYITLRSLLKTIKKGTLVEVIRECKGNDSAEVYSDKPIIDDHILDEPVNIIVPSGCVSPAMYIYID